MTTLLVLLLVLPAAGIVALFLAPAALAARIGTLAGVAMFVVSLLVLPLFDYRHAGRMQGQVKVSWVPTIGLDFHLGIDGISLPLLLLTTLLTASCLYYAQRTVDVASARQWFLVGAPIDDVITMLQDRRCFELPASLCSARAREIATTAQRMVARRKIA